MFGRRRLACSFCGKGEAEVSKLVAGPRLLLAGPRVYICDACVALASRLMEQDAGGAGHGQARPEGLLRRAGRRIAHAMSWGAWSSRYHAVTQR
jgi:hypothetical protein